MSIEDEWQAYNQKIVKIAEGVRNRILILDVERIDGITQQHWWDRGDLKNRYVHHETVIRQPRTTIFCAKWYDQPDVIQLAEWDRGGRKKFLREIHRLMSQADILVGHHSIADRERLVDYCAGDVIATQGLYDWARPYIKTHPALFVDGKDKMTVCNHCGHSTEVVPRRYVANVLTYTMRRCTECRAYSRLSIEPERMSMVRGV